MLSILIAYKKNCIRRKNHNIDTVTNKNGMQKKIQTKKITNACEKFELFHKFFYLYFSFITKLEENA